MQHWLDMGKATEESKQPKLYWVNWFRKGDDGSFLWPGFGENSRILKWVFDRIEGKADAVDTAIGRVPTADGLDTDGLDVSPEIMAELLKVDNDAWRGEIPLIEKQFEFIGERLPSELADELHELEKRLSN
jgi:phosphoenolpyruvate carboxykinase (GTP)